MKYNYHQDMDVVRAGTMPDRSYYIPSPAKNPTEEKADNSSVMMLNGTWAFRYYESAEKAEPEVRGDGEIEVPGNWQYFGYDTHQYVNIDYPIPYMPPYVPKENPCGCYQRDFVVEKMGTDRFFLNLEGADSCHYVFLNGQMAGYSQVSHSTSEYEITGLLKEGVNNIVIMVLKWCDGTYLEAQDKFRMSGIFRDIYVLRRPEQFLFDYTVKTRYTPDEGEIEILMSPTCENLSREITILNNKKETITCLATTKNKVVIKVDKPVPWNAEAPYLYRLELRTDRECILDRIGIREVTVSDRQVKLNGKRILLKGVNRHESHPDTGYVCSLERMKKDLAMMKKANLNAVRTSHYPDCPQFYRLCDEYGFYVCDEADMETHGAWTSRGSRDDEIYNRTQRDERFRIPFVDRVTRLVMRDKNRPCVLIWSLGNESGYGDNACAALRQVRTLDDTRLIHYESTVVSREEAGKYDQSGLDMVGIMYPELETVEKYFKKDYEKPLVLTEYAHAMGNGPGGLKEYFDQFYKYDSLAGGFVWEWCDHAVLERTENGEEHYLYGGDFGEKLHDGNFCVDGLVYPDRRPHTGLRELWNCARPVRIIRENNTYYLTNHLDFVNCRDYLSLNWTVKSNGKLLDSGTMPGISAEPGETVRLPLVLKDYEGTRLYLKIDMIKNNSCGLLQEGDFLGFEQFKLESRKGTGTDRITCGDPKAAQEQAGIEVLDTHETVEIKGSSFLYCFGKKEGSFVSMEREGQVISSSPVEYVMYRAPADNDMTISGRMPGVLPEGMLSWKNLGLGELKPYTLDVKICCRKRLGDNQLELQDLSPLERRGGIDMVEICCPLYLACDHMEPLAQITAVYKIDAGGNVQISLDTRIRQDISWLPRFGLRFLLRKEMDTCSYFGYGPGESYWDKKEGCYKDWFTQAVKDMHEDYIRPQENGSRFGTECCVLKDSSIGLRISSEKSFSFSVSEYTLQELEKKTHHFLLEKSGSTVLHLDYCMSGLGTGSCGPLVRPGYRLSENQFVFTFRMDWEEKK